MLKKITTAVCGLGLITSFALPIQANAENLEKLCENLDVEEYDNDYGASKFEKAIFENDLKTLEFYLKCGADPNLETGEDWALSIITWAVYGNADPEAIDLLIEYGGVIDNYSILSDAFGVNENEKLLRYILEKGALTNVRFEEDYYYEPSGNAVDDAGVTPLMSIAAYNPNPKIIETLIEYGADPMARDYRGRYAYDHLIQKNTEISHESKGVELLRKAKVEGNKRDDLLNQDFWAKATLTDVSKAIKNGSNVKAQDSGKISPLMYAAQYNPSRGTEIFAELIKNGADINAVDDRGQNALFYAIRGRASKEQIDFLIDNGIDKNHQDMLGDTALMLFVMGTNDFRMYKDEDGDGYYDYGTNGYDRDNPYIESGLALLENGVNANLTDIYGTTPLTLGLDIYSFAVREPFYLELINKSDVNIKNNEGESAFDIAERYASYHDDPSKVRLVIKKVIEKGNK